MPNFWDPSSGPVYDPGWGSPVTSPAAAGGGGLLERLFGGFGGGGDDSLYAGLLTPQQQSALRRDSLSRELAAMAGAFAKAAQPSIGVPGPGFGAAFGSAANAASGAGDAAQNNMMQLMLRRMQAQKLKDDMENRRAHLEEVRRMFGGMPGFAQPGAPSADGPLAAPAVAAPGVGPLSPGDAEISGTSVFPAGGPLAPGTDPDLSGYTGAVPRQVAMGPDTVIRPPGTPGLKGSEWEIANNNFAGMRKPGVIAGPSQGGFQSFQTPGEGVAAISHQLDRYASGATAGKPLTTIRQIVSTWAPPNENPTDALITRASQVVGADPDQPLDVGNPVVKAKLVEALIRNEQGGKLPVDPSLIQTAAGSGGMPAPRPALWANDPPGAGLRNIPGLDQNAQQAALAQFKQQITGVPAAPPGTQYAQAGGGGAPMPSGAPAAPAAPQAGPLQQQLNMLAKASALAKARDLPDPYGPMAETIRQSPAYQAEQEAAKERARLPFVGPKATAEELARDPFLRGRATQAEQERRKTAGEAPQKLSPGETVFYPPGSAGAQNIRNLQMRGQKLPDNVTVNQDGSVRVSGPNVGAPPTGYQYEAAPGGGVRGSPVPGTEQEQKAKEAERKEKLQQAQKQTASNIVIEEADEIEKLMGTATLPTTGFTGSLLQNLGGTSANDIRVGLATMRARLTLDEVNRMRQSSPTGAALGNQTEGENKMLGDAMGAAEQSQSKEQFIRRLRRVKRLYLEAIHGPEAAAQILAEPPEPKGGGAPTSPSQGISKAEFDALPSGTPFTAPDGSRRIKP